MGKFPEDSAEVQGIGMPDLRPSHSSSSYRENWIKDTCNRNQGVSLKVTERCTNMFCHVSVLLFQVSVLLQSINELPLDLSEISILAFQVLTRIIFH